MLLLNCRPNRTPFQHVNLWVFAEQPAKKWSQREKEQSRRPIKYMLQLSLARIVHRDQKYNGMYGKLQSCCTKQSTSPITTTNNTRCVCVCVLKFLAKATRKVARFYCLLLFKRIYCAVVIPAILILFLFSFKNTMFCNYNLQYCKSSAMDTAKDTMVRVTVGSILQLPKDKICGKNYFLTFSPRYIQLIQLYLRGSML